MTFSISLSLGAVLLLAMSLLLFVLVTWFCVSQGLFDDGGGYIDLSGFFVFVIYVIGWAMPSLVAWAVWATWFQ